MIEGLTDWRVCGEAATGGEAVVKVRDLQPDILLLDLTLPDAEATESILQIMAACSTTRVVALATVDSGELAVKALAAGASGMAMKSDPASDLLLSVRSIASNHPFLSSAGTRLLLDQLAKHLTPEGLPSDLTRRELEILKSRALGQTNKAIAESLNISVKTVDAHRANIMRKLKLADNGDLIQFAIRHKLIDI